MKKLLSFVAAALCAAAVALSAGAYVDLTKCRAVWDPETDNINYVDIQTGKLMAIEYPDGRIVEVVDETVEPEESEEPYDPWYDTEETEVALDPDASIYAYAVDGVVEGSVGIDYYWYVDGFVVERQKSGSTSWTTVYEESALNSSYYNFKDSGVAMGSTYIYRIRAYKSTLGIREYICEAQTSVFVEYSGELYMDSAKIGFDTVKLTVFVGETFGAKSAVLYRCDSATDSWTRVGVSSEFFEPEYSWDKGLCVTFTDAGLKPETDYRYRFDFYDGEDGKGALITSLNYETRTESKPADPELLTPEAHSESIIFTATIDERWCADGFLVQKYNFSKKKWYNVKLEDESLRYYDWDENDHRIYAANFTATELKSATKYRYRIRFYRLDGEKKEVIKTVDSSTVYTLLAAPKLELGASAKKANLSWSKTKNADGYEIYVTTVKPGDYSGGYDWYFWGYGDYSEGDSLSYYNQSYESSTLYPMNIDQFKKKTTIKDGKTSYSYTIKSNLIYVYRVRAYQKVSGKKLYSDFSNQVTTDSTSALLNGITLKSQVTVNDYDLGLIKAALKKCVNSKMSNAQKAAAVYDYVHNIATYEYDYSKIPADSIEAILVAHRGQCYQYAVTYQAMMKYLGFDVKLVSGKTSSGGPHWWCQLNCRGTDYMLDPQVGGRFLIRYDQMGYYAVTKEKVYD